MQRVQQNTPATLQVTFTDADGVPVDPTPATATVTITRADGTQLSTGSAAHTTTGTFTHALTTADTALVDTLTVTWTSSLGTITETVEVAGQLLASIGDLRAYREVAGRTTQEILDAIALAETAFEDAAGIAFTRRYALETHDGTGTPDLLLGWPSVLAIRSASVSGTPLASGDLGGLTVNATTGVVSRSISWTAGSQNVTVGYEHGMRTTPPRVSRAIAILARTWLTSGPVTERATQMTSEFGPINLAIPGLRGSQFGIPEVDATLMQYGGYRNGFA